MAARERERGDRPSIRSSCGGGGSFLTQSHLSRPPPQITRKELLDKQQRKIDELERRARELAKQKAENEAAWITKQRELELQKLREEQDLIVEAKR